MSFSDRRRDGGEGRGVEEKYIPSGARSYVKVTGSISAFFTLLYVA